MFNHLDKVAVGLIAWLLLLALANGIAIPGQNYDDRIPVLRFGDIQLHALRPFLDAENRSLKCSRLPSAAELEGAEQIILTKPADSTYYTEFCRQISRLQKEGQIPEDLGGK